MRKSFSFLFILMGLVMYAQNNNINTTEKKYVEVTGVAEMDIVPDEIYISITLQEEKDGQKRSVEDQEKILTKQLEKLNVDLKNLKLSNISSYTHWDKKTQESYKQKSFELKLNNAGKASEVLYHLNSLEINRMYVAKTTHSEIEKYRKQVKIDAVKAAKEKATYLLEAVNEEVGDVIFIVEQDNNYYGGIGYANVRTAMADESYIPNPEVEFKPITLKYNILARFEIK